MSSLVDIKVKNMLHLRDLIQLSQHVGYTIKGFLEYIENHIETEVDESLRHLLFDEIEKLNTLIDKGLWVIFRLHSYTDLDFSGVIAVPSLSTRNQALNFIKTIELDNRCIFTLLKELVQLFVKLANCKRRLVNFHLISLFTLGSHLIHFADKLYSHSPKTEKIFSRYLYAKGLLSKEKIQETKEFSAKHTMPFQEALISKKFLSEEILKQEWTVLENLGEQQHNWTNKEKKKYLKDGLLQPIFEIEISKQLDFLKRIFVDSGKQEQVCLQHEVDFSKAFKSIYHHMHVMPPALWRELLEQGLLVESINSNMLNSMLRDTFYVNEQLAKRSLGSREIRDIRLFIENDILPFVQVDESHKTHLHPSSNRLKFIPK